MNTFRVVVSQTAERHIWAIDDWWRKNRPSAPGLFEEELAAATANLAMAPFSGIRYPVEHPRGVRRHLLPRTQHHIYYTVDEASETVFIRAVWHTARGHGPRLG